MWSGAAMGFFGFFCVFYLIPNNTEYSRDFTLQPSLYPSIAAWVIALMGTLLFVLRLFQQGTVAEKHAGLSLGNLWHLVIVMSLLGAAVFAFERIGFLITGILLVLALMLYVGERRPLRLAATSFGAPLFIFGVFELLLKMPLP